jgi:hypothetical protein
MNCGTRDKESTMWQWMYALGYNSKLQSIRSRNFMMTFHSSVDLVVKVHSVGNADLDMKANLLVMDKFGQVFKKTKIYELLYTFSEQVLAFSYAVRNLSSKPIDAEINFKNSKHMLYGS